MIPTSDEHNKWALLIGINRYPLFAPRGQLNGCVNDVQVMRQTLIGSFKFPEEHITLLADEQATRVGILTAMGGLVERVGQDDIVVVHYSGHGSQMTDVEGDEADGLDETIVPHDSGRVPHENRDIKDDEIYLWLQKLTAKTSAVTLIFDCCHSGTITRDAFGEEMRWVEADLRPPEELPPSPVPPDVRVALSTSRDLGPSGWLPLGERYVLIAGCRSEERSYEIEEPAGVRHGALTYFLTQELLQAEPGTTYRDLFEVVAPRVTSRLSNQHPQLEGARDLEVFGVHRIEPLAFVPVRERNGDRVVLGGGAVCGLREGSQWAVFKTGTKTMDAAEPLGRVSITAVRAVTSEGTVLEESHPQAIAAGMRAVEESRALDTRLPILVKAGSRSAPDVQLLLKKLDDSPLLQRAEWGESAKVCVYLLPPGALEAREGAVPMLGRLTEETWAVVGENGELLMPAHGRSEQGVIQTLIDNLEKAARYRLVLDLENDKSALDKKVEVSLSRWNGIGCERPEIEPNGQPVFYEGERVALTITNRCDRPLHVYVLDLGLTGRISLVYPVTGVEEKLAPGRTIEIGTRLEDEMEPYVPDDFGFGDPNAVAVERLKIFATTHPTDFLPLLQKDFREGLAGPATTLNDLVAVTFGGGGYRDFRDRPPGSEPEDWTVLSRSFVLRRPGFLSQRIAGGRGV
jgi:hypothetical protein